MGHYKWTNGQQEDRQKTEVAKLIGAFLQLIADMPESLVCLHNVIYIEVFLENKFSVFCIHIYWILFKA
jgi:hypothetical protein